MSTSGSASHRPPTVLVGGVRHTCLTHYIPTYIPDVLYYDLGLFSWQFEGGIELFPNLLSLMNRNDPSVQP